MQVLSIADDIIRQRRWQVCLDRLAFMA